MIKWRKTTREMIGRAHFSVRGGKVAGRRETGRRETGRKETRRKEMGGKKKWVEGKGCEADSREGVGGGRRR